MDKDLKSLPDISSRFKKLLTKKVDRKDFLRYSGTAAVTLVGLSALTKLSFRPNKQDSGFGGGPYGGTDS